MYREFGGKISMEVNGEYVLFTKKKNGFVNRAFVPLPHDLSLVGFKVPWGRHNRFKRIASTLWFRLVEYYRHSNKGPVYFAMGDLMRDIGTDIVTLRYNLNKFNTLGIITIRDEPARTFGNRTLRSYTINLKRAYEIFGSRSFSEDLELSKYILDEVSPNSPRKPRALKKRTLEET